MSALFQHPGMLSRIFRFFPNERFSPKQQVLHFRPCRQIGEAGRNLHLKQQNSQQMRQQDSQRQREQKQQLSLLLQTALLRRRHSLQTVLQTVPITVGLISRPIRSVLQNTSQNHTTPELRRAQYDRREAR